jgi:putative membrane protein
MPGPKSIIMKKLLNLSLVALLATAVSCDSGTHSTNNNNTGNEDSKEVAEEQNDKKFDDANTEDDVKFAMDAADGGMMEVRMGELAQTNGSSPEIKAFGKSMVVDHGKANEELKALAATKNISLPADMSEDMREKCDDLAKKKGHDFDKAYADLMVDDHKDDIDKFEKEAEKGKDPEIKAWAAEKLATLRHHLQMADNMKEALKNKH